MICSVCGISGCGCLFIIKRPRPVCKKCAGSAQQEELAEINYLQKEQMNLEQVRKSIQVYHADGSVTHFNNVLRGRPAFLVCGGTSLNSLDLSLLHQRGVVTMGVNNSPSIIKTNYWVSSDDPVRFIEQIYRDPTIVKFLPSNHREFMLSERTDNGRIIKRGVAKDAPNVYFFNRGKYFDESTFLTDVEFQWGTRNDEADKTGTKGFRSTMLLALKLLWYLGAGKVYLLGVDFKSGQNQHYAFAQRTTDKEEAQKLRALNANIKRLALLKPYFDKAGFEVFNCNTDSALKVFPFVSYEDAIADATRECSKPINTEGMYNVK